MRPPVHLPQPDRRPRSRSCTGAATACACGASDSKPGATTSPTPTADAAGIELTAGQFQMILDGIDLSRVRRFKRFLARLATNCATRPAERCCIGHGRHHPAPDAPLPDDVADAPGAGPRSCSPRSPGCVPRTPSCTAKLDAALKHRFGRRIRTPRPTPRADGRRRAAPTARRPRPRRLARTPRTPRGRPRPDRGGEALPLLRPAARRASASRRPSNSTWSRPGSSCSAPSRRATPAGTATRRRCRPEQRLQTAGPAQVGPIAKGLCGPGLLAHVDHRQVRRPRARCTAWPGNWPAPA